jgi:hypothetical protein
VSEDRLKRAEQEVEGAQQAITEAYGDLGRVMDSLKKMAETKSTYGIFKEFPKKPHAEVTLRLLSDYTHALKVFSDFHHAWREACDEFIDASAEFDAQQGG